MAVEELPSSELGTKSYWDTSYATEIENFDSHGDPGEVWFGEEAAARVVAWLEDRETEGELQYSNRLVDLGCGNGMLCVDLAQAGWLNVTGLDYSPGAVELARKVAARCGVEVEYRVADLLQAPPAGPESEEKFDIMVDKGTLDAISLSCSAAADRPRYLANLAGGLTAGGLLLLTSCNWTEQELVRPAQISCESTKSTGPHIFFSVFHIDYEIKARATRKHSWLKNEGNTLFRYSSERN